jgi:hypothetical protein
MRTGVIAAASLAILLAAGTAEASPAGRCGGTGGPDETSLTCPSGQYVIGLSARGGMFVDQVGVRCAPFDAAGKRIGQGSWRFAGPGGGNHTADNSCASTMAATEIVMNSGIYVDRIVRIGCMKRKAGGFEEGQYPGPKNIGVGGTLGFRCNVKCPGGEALFAVIVTHGSWVDSIRGACRR